MRSGEVKHRLNLLGLHAWKVVQKYVDRIAGLQVVKQTFDRHARAAKNRLASQTPWILLNTLGQAADGFLIRLFHCCCHLVYLYH